jgi:dTMP kinase
MKIRGEGIDTETPFVEIDTPDGTVVLKMEPSGRLRIEKKKDPNAPARGKLIVFEGIDGAGTSTQAAHATAFITTHYHTPHFTSEPTDGPIGSIIRQVLRGEEEAPDNRIFALLFAADRLHHYLTEIDPILASGRSVICDRYVMSGLAYDVAAGLDADWAYQLNQFVPFPDLTIFLAIDPKVALQRIEDRGGEKFEQYENIEFLTEVEDVYRQLMTTLQERGGNIEAINGGLLPRVVSAYVENAIVKLLGSRPSDDSEPVDSSLLEE